MFKTRFRKVWRDVWFQKTRTLLVILTIAIGAMTVGTLSRTTLILSTNLSRNYLAANPASGMIFTQTLFNEDLVENIAEMPEVAEAQGRYTVRAKVNLGGEIWYPLSLIAIDDYNEQEINLIEPEAGIWPPAEARMAFERTSLEVTDLTAEQTVAGKTAMIEMPDGKLQALQLAGVVYDVTQYPSNVSGVPSGYIDLDTLEALIGVEGFNELHFTVAENPQDADHIQHVLQLITQKIEANRLIITEKQIPTPLTHPMDNGMQAALFILQLLGVMAMVLSLLLVINIVSIILARQIAQIGVLKAIGMKSRQIFVMYIGMVFAFGFLAFVIAVPLASLNAYGLTNFMAGLFNINILNYQPPTSLYILDIFTAIIIPLLATMYPVIKGSRTTVREAIDQLNAKGSEFGTGLLDRLLGNIQQLPTSLRYAMRNAFRYKGRLAFIVVSLTVAGSIFIAIVSVRASLFRSLDDIAAYWSQDIKLIMREPYRWQKVEQAAQAMPHVMQVEGRMEKKGVLVHPDGQESKKSIVVMGVPAESPFLQPTLLAGRWLTPDDQNAIVINIDLLEEADVEVGSEIVLNIEGREERWQVVGMVTGQLMGAGWLLSPIVYVPYPHLAQVLGEVGQVNRLLVDIDEYNNSLEISQELEEELKEVRLHVASSELNVKQREGLEESFEILLSLMFIMTILFAIVGGLGLMGMMSLNVLERTREIAVIRAMGGRSAYVNQIVIAEGMFIGFLSWFFGAVAALPLSKFMSDTVGVIFLKTPLNYIFSVSGIVIWFVVVILLAIISSFLPARNASKVSVRKALSYE